MEGGLSERFPEKVSPVKRHVDHMIDLGAKPGIVRQGLNNITSDVIKMFAYAAREYNQKHPEVKFEDYVDIALQEQVAWRSKSQVLFSESDDERKYRWEKENVVWSDHAGYGGSHVRWWRSSCSV